MEKIKTTPVRGTNDILPKECELRQNVINTILDVYKKNGFLQVSTPILENISLLTLGDTGDNQKMMFKTVKRGAKLNLEKPNLTESDIVEEGLRYDLTVPLSRMYAGNREKLPLPFKSIQIGESFRAERPQLGRDRQFTQCDVDLWGESDNIAETEIILTALQVYKTVGLESVIAKISDRKILQTIILNCGFSECDINSVCITIDKLDKIFIEGVKQELIEKEYNINNVNKLINALNDVKQNGISALNKYGVDPLTINNISEIITNVKAFIPNNFDIVFDISIVRGQGYYTGTVFEFYETSGVFKGAIGGGGRYDKMLEKYLGQNVPAVGCGIGLVPVLLLLQNQKLEKSRKKIALLYYNDTPKQMVLTKKFELMANYDVSIFKFPKNFKDFILKLQNNNFDGITKIDKTEIEYFK